MRSLLLVIFSIIKISFLSATSQVDSSKLERYSPSFKFKEGLYINYQSFKNNNPIPCNQIISDIECGQANYYIKLISQKNIKYINFNKDTIEIKAENVWGFSKGSSIFIIPQSKYFPVSQVKFVSIEPVRLVIIGKICTYVEMEKRRVYTGNYYTEKHIPVERMLVFETGIVRELNNDSFEEWLSQDETLSKEYHKYKGKKREKIYTFINKFNQKYPIYFPK